MAVANSSSSTASGDESSSSSRLESSSSLASFAQNIQRTVLQSTDSAIRSSRSLKNKSSTHIRSVQDHFPEVISKYRAYEDVFINKIKDGLIVAKEQPAVAIALAISAALVMRAPRRFLFRHTLGRLQSEEARYASAEKNVRGLSHSVDLMKEESKNLLERAALAEKVMKYGHNELMSTGTQIQRLAKLVYKFEAQAVDLTDRLRDIPSRESLALRAEVASITSILSRQRLVLHKRITKISELGIPV